MALSLSTEASPASIATGFSISRPHREEGSHDVGTDAVSASLVDNVTSTRLEEKSLSPRKDASGKAIGTLEEYSQHLETVKRKQPLKDECQRLHLKFPKTANLERLKGILLNHWFPSLSNAEKSSSTASAAEQLTLNSAPLLPDALEATHAAASHATASQATSHDCNDEDLPPNPLKTQTDAVQNPPDINSTSEEADLIRQFNVDGASGADELLGYDDDVDDDDEEFEDEEDEEELDTEIDSDDLNFDTLDSPRKFKAYQAQIRVEATTRAEGNRRKGGIKTQQAMVKAWNEFIERFKNTGQIKDGIVDEHSLLLFIKFSAERPKRTRRGEDIPGTFLGASQLKKLFFGALRIRKEQEAADSTLSSKRRATSVVVWDAIKNRMDEALERVRNGLVPNEDAADIVANTFLAEVTDEELDKVGRAFLCHRELRCAINGHLAWTAQHASGNRGDDLRALKLCEMVPWGWLHPNNETQVYTVLGLQGEEKAGKRGMRTTVNPSYTSFIAHRVPEKCPLGALAFLLHYLHDVQDLQGSEKIDWKLNKSWRGIRLLHSQKSGTSVYSEQSLYNLYVKAFASAGLDSKLKVHLARHILGYLQERLGVDSRETAKLGWRRGETYSDVYSPSIPKTAVLGCHGYKESETYDPVWRHVNVPEAFQKLVCPMAEGILNEVRGGQNLRGTTGHWEMIITLRSYVFQCAAAIYQICPESPIFKLPALANRDVRNWMTTTYPSELAALQANAGNPVDLERIQNRTIQLAFEESRSMQSQTKMLVQQLMAKMDRRTAILSPAKGFSQTQYHNSFLSTSSNALLPLPFPLLNTPPVTPPRRTQELPPTYPIEVPAPEGEPLESMRQLDDTGVYEANDETFRAFVNDSPKSAVQRRARTQVDMVLPPLSAFQAPGQPLLLWPPVLGQKGVTWATIFSLVRVPKELWAVWKPSKTLDQYKQVQALWDAYNEGEAVYVNDEKTGMGPPLRMVEQHFGTSWRAGQMNNRKVWERFREIPEWIEICSSERGASPSVIIQELEDMKKGFNDGLHAFHKKVKVLRIKYNQEQAKKREEAKKAEQLAQSSSPSCPSSPLLMNSSSSPPVMQATKKCRAKAVDRRPSKRAKTKEANFELNSRALFIKSYT